MQDLILDSHNPTLIDGISIAARVRRQGKDHLWDERSGAPVDTVVIHYISAAGVAPCDPFSVEKIIAILCDQGLSSHYLIDRIGVILRLVPGGMKAWHAGGSIMPPPDARTAVNDFSLGIELVATHESGFTDEQYSSVIRLCRDLQEELGRPLRCVGHEHVAGIEAVKRGLRAEAKVDPGPLFDWDRLRHGLEP